MRARGDGRHVRHQRPCLKGRLDLFARDGVKVVVDPKRGPSGFFQTANHAINGLPLGGVALHTHQIETPSLRDQNSEFHTNLRCVLATRVASRVDATARRRLSAE